MKNISKISFLVLILFIFKSNQGIHAQSLLESSNTMIYLNQDALIKINGNLKTTGANSINNNGVIKLNGDLLCPMIDTSNNFYGRVFFSGNEVQTIQGTEGLKFNEIVVEKANERLFLETNLLIRDSIHLIEGVIDINEYHIYLEDDAKITTEDAFRYITGSNGYIEANRILDTPFISNPGNIGIEITVLNDLGNTRVRRYHDAINADGVNTIKRMFEVIPENPLTEPATVTFYYIDNEEERGGIPKAAINAFIYNNDSWNLLSTTQDTANNALTITQLSSFSLLTGSIGPFLPVEFLEFKVTNIDQRIARLNWTTATEINNDYFTIQRSIDGEDFEDLAFVEGAGNSSQIIKYEFDDLEPLLGVSYYRIKQTDYDGSTDYSPIRSVVFNQNNEVIIYPNPSNLGFVNFEGIDKNTYISIFNHLGQQVFYEQKKTDIETPYKFETKNLLPGIYHLNLKSRFDDTDYFKFIIY